jgi:hypothetical protein
VGVERIDEPAPEVIFDEDGNVQEGDSSDPQKGEE